MNRNLGLLARAVFGLILAFLSQYVHAETTAATAYSAGTTSAAIIDVYSGGGATEITSFDCSHFVTDYPPGSCGSQVPTYTTPGYCGRYFANSYCSNNTVYKTPTCPTGYALQGTVSAPTGCTNTTTVYKCPATGGWTLSGQTCTRPDCVAPRVRQSDGSCSCPPSGTSVSGVSGRSYTGSGSNPSSMCIGGCLYNAGSSVAGATTWSGTAGRSAGGSCTATTPVLPVEPAGADSTAPKTPEGCMAAGQSYATMAGVTVCVAQGSPGAAPTTQKSTSSASSSSSTGGSSGSTSTNTTSVNPDGTVTQTVDTTNSDGSTSSKSSTASPDQFCKDNPTDKMCVSKAANTECEDHPERAGCKDLGDAPTAPAIDTQTVPLTFNPMAISQNASCPAPIPLTLGGRAMNIEFDAACTYASGLRPIVIAMAYLSAALIVFGVGKSDG